MDNPVHGFHQSATARHGRNALAMHTFSPLLVVRLIRVHPCHQWPRDRSSLPWAAEPILFEDRLRGGPDHSTGRFLQLSTPRRSSQRLHRHASTAQGVGAEQPEAQPSPKRAMFGHRRTERTPELGPFGATGAPLALARLPADRRSYPFDRLLASRVCSREPRRRAFADGRRPTILSSSLGQQQTKRQFLVQCSWFLGDGARANRDSWTVTDNADTGFRKTV